MNLPFNDSMIFISWPSRVHRVNQTTLFTLREVGIQFRLARDGCIRFDIRLDLLAFVWPYVDLRVDTTSKKFIFMFRYCAHLCPGVLCEEIAQLNNFG